ncbi:endonuclease domain-containing protein [Microbacterium sp. ZW T5_56]|uniref:endonuclease domain-containing protein n=1 Tax=Microbacterium sp. ZW T5_56 TaxID=3378081 RepID=UPI003854CA1B
MNLLTWLQQQGGIAHRKQAWDAGFDARHIRPAVAAHEVTTIGRNWIASHQVDADLVAAAQVNGRVACVTAAASRGWWMPDSIPRGRHLHVSPHSSPAATSDHLHRNRPLVAVPRGALIESVEDSLQHIATCCDPESALIIWESACRTEKLSAASLRLVVWASPAARRLAEEVTGLADSGLETILARGLAPLNCRIRPQVLVADHRVDALLGDWLVLQVDGHEFHSSSATRTRDVRHDAELALRGYTVLRFTYAQVIHDWAAVYRTVARAVAQRRHARPR